MENIKIENTLDTNNDNAEIVTEAQNVIVKINNLAEHRLDPQFYVDLMSDDLVRRYGRRRPEEATDRVFMKAATDLSERFTNILRKFKELYFRRLNLDKVDVRYMLGGDYLRSEPYTSNGRLVLAASSEPVMVVRLLRDMALLGAECDCERCMLAKWHRLFLAGAPLEVAPEMLHLSAEEFIAKETYEPMTEEEYKADLRQECIAAWQAKGPELN